MPKERNLLRARILLKQYSLIHRLQASSLGFSERMILTRVSAGLWEETLPNVYGLPEPRTSTSLS